MSGPDSFTSEQKRMQRETIGGMQRRATADEILARIVADLRLQGAAWSLLDVDVRNQIVSGWRAKIVSELEAYF